MADIKTWLAGLGIAIQLICVSVAPARAQTAADAVPSNPLKNAYFGELHLHTSYSLDSFIFANPNDPDAAYKFAQGQPVTLYGGETKQLKHPMDFVAITDHSEFLGELTLCSTPGSSAYDSAACKGIRSFDMRQFAQIANSVTDRKRREDICGADGVACVNAIKGTWKKVQDNAARYYQPGKFTTLIGYEYSINIPGSKFGDSQGKPSPNASVPGMLHRNVIFGSDHVPDTVFSAYEGTGEELQKWLEEKCTGPCKVLTIPHNSNYSFGRFFWQGKNSDGTPWTKDILDRRARIEPLVEIFQIKGSSECAAGVGLTDEECGFENSVPPCPQGETEHCGSPDSFVRDAIVNGLAVDEKMGVNPLKYGFVAATDNHDGTPSATEEDTFRGHLGQQDNTPEKRLGIKPGETVDDGHGESGSAFLKFNPGGLTGVWATKNTRESIFGSLAQRETFGTSGTRIRVRFFGGFDYPQDLNRSPDLVKIGYEKGVPMGGDLKAAPAGKSPRFVVWATRDPDSAPLQKIQIVKGWIENGKSVTRIYDVVCSDGITADPKTGLCADNGAAVDLATCKMPAGKGAGELSTTWADPAFDPKTRAVYYVRVLEDPVCRWSTYDAMKLKIAPSKAAPAMIKERAWTSPIWYTPAARG
jgi:hypothetical protein